MRLPISCNWPVSRTSPATKKLAECRRQFKEVLVPKQMAADGSFPAELARTKPYAYSIFQLDNMVTLCQVLSKPDDDLWTFALGRRPWHPQAIGLSFIPSSPTSQSGRSSPTCRRGRNGLRASRA